MASGSITTLAARKATRTIPVVMQAMGDPVGTGAVRSLSRPEGNVTGVSFISSELAPKRLQLIKELVPGAKRVAVLWDSRNPNAVAESRATLAAAKGLAIQAEPFPLTSDSELQRAFEIGRAHV